MHKPSRPLIALGDERGEFFHQRNRQVARESRGARDGIARIQTGFALGFDDRPGGFWSDPCSREGARQRRFEIQHSLQPAGVGENFAHPAGSK